MDPWIIVSVVASLVVLVLLVTLWVTLARVRPSLPRIVPASPAVTVERRAVVVLDVGPMRSSGPAVDRLVHEAAARVLAALPDAEDVEVRARDGSVLGRSSRSVPEAHEIWLPQFLHEPHHGGHRGPDLTGHLQEDEPFVPPRRDGPFEPAAPGLSPPRLEDHRAPIAECFDLIPAIRAAVRDPDDPVEVVRAILETGGVGVEADEDLLRVDDLGIAVVRVDGDSHEALNHAYRQIVGSGAARGLVVALGYVLPEEIRRRQLLAPKVLHTGFAGVQRMADAVALGADPLRFATSTALAAPRADRRVEPAIERAA